MLARRRLLPFVKRLNPKYLAGWVHEDICRRLEQFSADVAAGLSPRLMILMPPRHGKSELASKMFPAWHLGRHADHEIIACSYNVSLAMSFSRKVKEVIDDPSYETVFQTRLDPDNRSMEEWGVLGTPGGYVAAGVGGGITGKGCNILVVDDPLKNAEEADSAETREKLWDWYGSTAYTRLAPGGGVLTVQCMAGDTPVRMADGTERRLDHLRVGDEVATYGGGVLSTSHVAAWKSNGHDDVFKITTKSGKSVRANGRHPFLATTTEGLKWVRTQDLTTDHTIVALKDSAANGLGLRVQARAASFQPSVEGSAHLITTSRSGRMDIARRPSTQNLVAPPTSNTGMASPRRSTLASWLCRAANALSAAFRLSARRLIGAATFASITATNPAKSAGCSATTATLLSDMQKLNVLRWPWPRTSAFTADPIVSIEPAGKEEVFDVQIDRTENFIANGLVSHNTWWHDDDLAGRLQAAMAADPEADQFVVVKYPAVAEADEYLDEDTDLIQYDEAPGNGRLLRLKGEPLHPARYDLAKLNRIRKTIPTRFWSALYQQNPVPDDGSYFVKDQFRRGEIPSLRRCRVYIAWDFAISEKKQNDYTVGTVGLQDEDDVLHIAEVVRFKSGDAFFIVNAILALAARWADPSLVLGFEDGQIFRAIEALLKKRMRENRTYYTTQVLKPLTDKMVRARALQARMQQGMVSFNIAGDWYDTVRTEMLRFPAGVHDDCVDSAAWVAQMVIGQQPPRKAQAAPPKSWRDKLRGLAGTATHMSA